VESMSGFVSGVTESRSGIEVQVQDSSQSGESRFGSESRVYVEVWTLRCGTRLELRSKFKNPESGSSSNLGVESGFQSRSRNKGSGVELLFT
uniref:Uncharacterized protein n=1 Tax=Cannabis sativa TaxID=3483 RepID=A0A803QRK9_CANSA